MTTECFHNNRSRLKIFVAIAAAISLVVCSSPVFYDGKHGKVVVVTNGVATEFDMVREDSRLFVDTGEWYVESTMFGFSHGGSVPVRLATSATIRASDGRELPGLRAENENIFQGWHDDFSRKPNDYKAAFESGKSYLYDFEGITRSNKEEELNRGDYIWRGGVPDHLEFEGFSKRRASKRLTLALDFIVDDATTIQIITQFKKK